LMRIKVSLPSYKQIDVEIDKKKTAKDLKRIVCEKLEIEPDLTKLLLQGRLLSDRTQIRKLKGLRAPVIIDYLWARHLIAWGSEGQRKIKSASVLLAGAGAIGNEVAKNLAMLGVGRLIIVDRDTVELSNVSRMIFFEPSELGMNKAEVLARNIHDKYPYVETLAFRGELEKMPLKFYLDSDVVVCGLDNVISRIYLAQTCRRYSIPLVDGGITGLSARVHTYVPPDDPCPICIFPPNQYSQIVGLRNPCDAPLDEGAVPSFATSISLVSSILAQETIKVILGQRSYRETKKWPPDTGEPLRSVLFVDLKNNRFTLMNLKRGEKCFVCGKQGTAAEVTPRMDIAIKEIEKSGFASAIQAIVKDRAVGILLESSHGEKLIPTHGFKGKFERGDYLRVLAEAKNGELCESILRLT